MYHGNKINKMKKEDILTDFENYLNPMTDNEWEEFNKEMRAEYEQEDINHPEYYSGGVETIEIVRYYCFNIGNVIKYLARAGKKEISSEAKDLNKALWYLNDYIEVYLHRHCLPMRSEPLKTPSFLNYDEFLQGKKYGPILELLKDQGLICNMCDGDVDICLITKELIETEILMLNK